MGYPKTATEQATLANLGAGERPVGAFAYSNPAYGDVLYVNSSGQFAKAEANASTTLPAVGLYAGGNFVETKEAFTKHDWSWTPGGIVYVSASTAGTLTQTAPSAGGTYVQAMGVALSATTILLMPSMYLKAN